jgi:hypothetical protein
MHLELMKMSIFVGQPKSHSTAAPKFQIIALNFIGKKESCALVKEFLSMQSFVVTSAPIPTPIFSGETQEPGY